MFTEYAKKLKKNVHILKETFEANNLKILHIGVKPFSATDADCIILVEVTTITGSNLPANLMLKVNLYDDDGLFASEKYYISNDSFDGYDTFSISIYNDGQTLMRAKKARMYITRA